MVGRLIKQKQIRLHDQKAGQMGAHDPAAAQFLGLPLEVLLLVAKTPEDLLGLSLDLWVAEGRVLGRGFAVLRGIDSAGLLKFLEAFFQSRNLSGPTGGDIEDGLISRGLTLLGEMADHGPLIPFDRARIGLILF